MEKKPKCFFQGFSIEQQISNHLKNNHMHQKLILLAFNRAKDKINRKEHFPAAQELVDFIESVTGKTYTARSLASKYISAREGSKNVRLKPFLIQPLCEYLGYMDFENFKKDHPTEDNTASRILLLWRKCWFKFVLYHIFLILLGIAMYTYAVRERWMVWNEDHYVEVKFDTDLYGTRLKVYKKERVANFKKVNLPCEGEFFNPDGTPQIWYGRNLEGELQYFTDFGLHPETGKTLKPITQYIVDKYICSED